MGMTPTQLRLHREHVEREKRFKRAAESGAFKRHEADRSRRNREANPVTRQQRLDQKWHELRSQAEASLSKSPRSRSKAIVRFVAERMAVKESDIYSESRRLDLCDARHICVYLLRQCVPLQACATARFLNRDHSTIRHSMKIMQRAMAEDESFRNKIDKWVAELTEQSK